MRGRRVLRAYWGAGAGCVAAAVIVGLLNAASPFESGRWLASSLCLVGAYPRCCSAAARTWSPPVGMQHRRRPGYGTFLAAA